MDQIGPASRFRSVVTTSVALLPFALMGFYKLLVLPRPFWVAFYDPENIYFYNGLRILEGQLPNNIDNPGTPVQALSAIIALFTGRSILRFEQFLDFVHPLLFALHIAAAILLIRTVFRDAPPAIQIAAIWTYFTVPLGLERAFVWAPEGFYFPLGAVVLFLLHRWSREPRMRTAILLGVVLGFCVATKILLGAWAAGALAAMLVAKRWRHALATSGGMVVGMMVAILPILPMWLDWLNLLDRLHTLNVHDRSFLNVLRTAPWWPILIVSIFLFVAWRRRHMNAPLAVFGTVAIVLCYAAGSSNPHHRYFYPTALAAVALLASVANVRAPRDLALAAFLVICGFALSAAMLREFQIHHRRVTSAANFRVKMSRMIPPGSVVIYSFAAPAEVIAMAASSGPREHAEIGTRYPLQGHYNPWYRKIVLPPGVDRWDYLVIPRQRLEGFPEPIGEKIGSFERFDVYAAPAGNQRSENRRSH